MIYECRIVKLQWISAREKGQVFIIMYLHCGSEVQDRSEIMKGLWSFLVVHSSYTSGHNGWSLTLCDKLMQETEKMH